MKFGQVFESKVNEGMQDDGQPGRAPTEAEDYELDVKKKGHLSPQLDHEDAEMHHKKDAPPRFSTLFASAPPKPPQPPREYIQEYYPRSEKRSGVFMPMPLFIVFAIILFFESTILFAYTVIGLYNNAPSRLFPWAGPGKATAACDCGERQPAVNISPHFVLPQGSEPITEVVTISVKPTTTTTSTSSSSSSTSSTTSSSSASEAADIASDIAGILGSLTTSPSSFSSSSVNVVTVTPTRSTVDVTTVVTEDPSGNPISGPPTVTRTTLVDGPTATTVVGITSRNAAAWASISSAIAENNANLTPDPVPSTTSTPTTLETSTTPAPTTEGSSATTSVSPSATGQVCFGGSGGVQLNCV